MKKIIVITGATGVGKTRFGVMLAKKINAEVVSADSMQIYKYMNIGTAKPRAKEFEKIPYHLIDFVDPKEKFDLARFIKLADEKIEDITRRSKIPLIVGGTGLYIKGLIEGIFEEESSDLRVREELKKNVAEKGLKALFERLKSVDVEAAKKIHPNDRQRILRALEVFEVTGKKISQLQKQSKNKTPHYDYKLIVLTKDRQQLYKDIERRVDTMIESGLIEEVRGLLENGYSPELQSMKAIGYREAIKHISGEWTLEKTILEIKKETRRYAKRQLTWWGAMKNAHWLSTDKLSDAQVLDFILRE